jgi:uncharacterized protein YjbI with pentapeptide repeats
LRQRKVARLADEKEHGKFSSRLKTAIDATKAKAKKLADEADWIFGRRTARVLGVVMLFAVVVALLLVFLDWYIAPTKPGDKKDLVLAMAQILAGTALLSGLYFTWRTLQVNREGQVTERFTHAIDQLGATDNDNNPRLELRLGGIYALERIARDSEKDHWPIMQVLTAYVQKRAPWKRDETLAAGAVPAVPPLDIQAILTVIARRERYYGKGEAKPLDLQGTDLQGSSALGGGVHLEGAYLQGANLSEAHLEGVHLEGARLGGAYLQRAHLEDAHLEGTFMDSSILVGERLVKGPPVHLENAILRGAHLKEARLSDARLESATLSEASLELADLFGAHLEGATLEGTSLEGASLEGTHLEGTDLSRAQGLTQEQVNVAIGDPSTTLPNGLVVPPEWEKPESEGFE